MTQPSKILIFILYDILIILTPILADMSSENFINDTDNTKLNFDTTNDDSSYKLDSPENVGDLKLVLITTYIMAFFNTVGCSLPFYTALADVGIDIAGILNITHTAVYARVWDQPTCTILSVVYFFFITINLALYGTVSMSTYLRVCRQFYFDLGKFDYKLWSVILAIATVFQLISGPYYGARKY
ncbi:17929_t:CDS:2, partial [Dentiscutata erythropus]